MADASPTRRRGTLTKQPPPSVLAAQALRQSLTKPQSFNYLQRTPSAPVYAPGQEPPQIARDSHQRTQSSTYDSSRSSLDYANGAASSSKNSSYNFAVSSAGPAFYPQASTPPIRKSTGDNRRDDLIGAPFDSSGLLSSINSTVTNASQSTAFHRPFPHQLNSSHTSPTPMMAQNRTSQTFGMGSSSDMEITPPRTDGTMSPKRFSMEQPNKPQLSQMRKKSGFSSFVNGMLGSPRNIKISAPENPVHMIHVGYDNVTGQFTVSNT